LRQVIVFQNAIDDDLIQIIQNNISHPIEEGEMFCFQGDLANYPHVLTSGQVKLLQTDPAG